MKEIKLTQGKVALVDDEDYDYLCQWKWYAAKRGGIFYAARRNSNVKNGTIHMHREVLKIYDSCLVPDHIDHNGLNNQRYNLRIATRSQNCSNRSISTKLGNSKYWGVSWHKGNKSWASRITKNGKRIILGYFSNEQEAAKVYNNAAIKLHGEFAKLNSV